MKPIRDRLDRARTADYLSYDECALLLGVSKATIRRAVALMPRLDIARRGRIVRIRRLALLKLFQSP